jgi:energy-coupling factor transporter ATP-binding protein EcfA2
VRESIRFSGVTFTYPHARRPALDDVSVEVPEGTFALAVGATGAGKSTLLRAMNGLVPHFTGGSFAGRVAVGGRSTLRHAPRDLADVVAFVPQDPEASFVLDRVEDELAYGMENLATPAAAMRRRIEEVVDLLDIEPIRNRSVRSLSGGERQRVAIAAALAAGPRILVLDEPTSQLDPQGAEDVLAAVQRLVHDHGLTAVLAEHRLERVAGFADLALGCRAGRVIRGAPSDVFGELGIGPPVARVGRALGWNPIPLTVRDARARASAADGATWRAGDPLAAPASDGGRSAGHSATVNVGDADVLLSAEKLTAGYGDVEVLRSVDLRLRRGEIVALVGRNGAGKTTLLRCLAGVHRPTGGTVRAAAGRPRPGIDAALCPNDPGAVLFSDTVGAEVAATVRARGGSGLATDRILRQLGIEGLADRHPRDVSAGQRVLVAAAAVVATEAPALLLDEPTRGLDPAAKGMLARFLERHAAGGNAAMVATHDVELAAGIASRVVMLAGGEVIADGPPELVLGDSHVFAPQMTRVFGPGWLTAEQVLDHLAPVR